jgi:hypothetical protein
MKRPGLIILSAAVVLVGGYALYDYRQANPDPEKKQAADNISRLKEDQIAKFSIQKDSEIIEVEKKDGLWKMTKPIQDQANQISSRDFVSGVTSEKMIEVAKEGEAIDWNAYGFDHPKAVITLSTADGKTESFSVGNAKNFEGYSFVRQDSTNKVLVASSTWFAKADKKAGDFRDQRLMRLPNSQITKLIFDHGKEKFSLDRKENIWLNFKQMKIRLDQNKVREILGMLNNTEAIEFVSEKAPAANDLKAWDLQNPSLRLTAETQDGKSWTAQFSSGKDRIYRVWVSDPQFVLKLSPVDAQKFILADFDSFRDRGEAFMFDRSKVKLVQIKQKDQSQELKNENDEKVAEIIKKISNLHVTSFMEKPGKDLNHQIILLGENNKQLLKLNWGEPKKIKIAGSEALGVEAQSSLVDYGFILTQQEMNDLKLQDKK